MLITPNNEQTNNNDTPNINTYVLIILNTITTIGPHQPRPGARGVVFDMIVAIGITV